MNCKGDDFEIFFLLESNNERIGLLRMGFEEWEVLREKNNSYKKVSDENVILDFWELSLFFC